MEIWEPVPVEGFEKIYSISNFGRVRREKASNATTSGRILKQRITNKGYKMVRMSNYPKYKLSNIHRLIALAFIPNPHGLPQVNHKDLDKQNNLIDNLEWVTSSGNYRHYLANTKRPPVTEETRKRLSIARKKDWELGKFSREFSIERKAKMSLARKKAWEDGKYSHK